MCLWYWKLKICETLFYSDFSTTQWLNEKSVTEMKVLPSFLSDELLESLSVRPYLKADSVCGAIRSSADVTGWNNGIVLFFFIIISNIHTRIFIYVHVFTFFCTLLNFQSVLTKAMCLPCPPSLCSVNWTLTVTK